jgi:hypothetical protein
MANTYTLIQSVTVGSGGSSSIVFSTLPNTYTDLVLKISARTNRSNVTDAISLKLNNVTTNQSSLYMESTGSSSNSGTLSTIRGQSCGNNATSGTFGNCEFYIPNYAGSLSKSTPSLGVAENRDSAAFMWLVSNLWNSTAAITDIEIINVNSATFLQHSTASLYGITKS